MNIAGGGETSINRLWQMIKEITGAQVEPIHRPPRKGDVRKSLADVSLAQKLLGWRPQTPLAVGLAQTVKWMKKHAG